jgi:hypothetical protein
MPHGNKVATTGASSGAPVRIASCAVTKRRRPSSATAALRTMKGTPRAANHSGASASAWLPLTARPATKRPSAVLSYARSVRSFARLQRGSGSYPAVDSVFVRGCTCFSLPRPCRWPTVVAMFPDFLFTAGMVHERWIDVFLGHISTHFVPGRNLTWFAVFLAALAVYLAVLARLPAERG